MLVASLLRCLPLWIPSMNSFTVFCHIAAFLNAMGGPIAMSAPIQISSAWFPPNERTRATGISQMFNALGVGISYLMGTLIVNEVSSDAKGLDFEGSIDQTRKDIELLL